MLTSNCAWIGIWDEHPVSDATASFQLTPSGAVAQPIAAYIRGIAPGPRSSNPTSLNNVDHTFKHLVELPRCIACLLESPACQKKPPTLKKIPVASSGCRTLADGLASSFSGDSIQFKN